VTSEVADLRRFLGECTRGILDGFPGLSRPEARHEAALLMATYAGNCKYTWRALRSALSRHPDLAAQLPDMPGPVDGLPLCVAMVHVGKDGCVIRQGAFAGSQEVKA
jgi:hypothetical protein